MEPRLGKAGKGKKVWDYTPEEIGNGGMEAVLRCPVGWSGDHRVVSQHAITFLVRIALLAMRSDAN
jgi:hypothetical protein